MYRQFNIQQFYVLPTQCIYMCFVWIWEQTAFISLYSINWLVFKAALECVYCAVRTDWLQFNSLHSDRTHCTFSAQLYEGSHCLHLLHLKTCQHTNTSEDALFSVSECLFLYPKSTCSGLFAPAQWPEQCWEDQLRTDGQDTALRSLLVCKFLVQT